MTAKPSQCGNDDSEVLKFKDFQGPLTSYSETVKALFHFQGLSRSWKNGEKEKKFKDFQGRVATLTYTCVPHMCNRLKCNFLALSALATIHLLLWHCCLGGRKGIQPARNCPPAVAKGLGTLPNVERSPEKKGKLNRKSKAGVIVEKHSGGDANAVRWL